MKTLPLLASILLLAAPADLLAQRPVTDEFRVNVQRSAAQLSFPEVALGSQGEFVVIWKSARPPGDPEGDPLSLYGRRYAADGTPVSGEIEISRKASYAVDAAVAMLQDGSFVVVYSTHADAHVNTSTFTFEGRRFAGDGTPIGEAFMVGTGHDAADLTVCPRPSGGFVVVWEAYRQVVPEVSFRLFGADAEPLGPEISITTGNDPVAAVGLNSEIVVSWMTGQIDPRNGESLFFVAGQRLGPGGRRRGGRLVVSEMDSRFVEGIQLAKDGAGNFLFTWSEIFGRRGPGVFMRRYDRNGKPLTGIVRLLDSQRTASLAMEGSGGFVLVWDAVTSGGSEVVGRRFTPGGQPLPRLFRINQRTRNSVGARVASDGADRFVVVWTGQAPDGGGTEVFARLYRAR